MNKISVLVVGAGMHVCGRGTESFGTILPALYQGCREGLVGAITIAATDPGSVKELRKRIKKLNSLFGFVPEIDCLPHGEKKDGSAYKKAATGMFRPDCAIICVPDHLHSEVASFLMDRGIHCLVVKPLAPTAREVDRLIRLQKARKIYGAVEFHKRYDRSNLKLRDVLAQGKIGDPLYFLIEYSQRKNIPENIFSKWIDRTNILQYLGIHYIDIIYFTTRATPLRVMAIGQRNYLASKGITAYDSIQCLIEWRLPNRNKFTSSILTNWIDPESTSAMSDQKIKVIGTRGRYEADQKNRGIKIISDKCGIEEPNPDFSSFYGESGNTTIQGYGPESILQYLKDVKSILAGEIDISDLEGHRPTFKEALVPTRVIEAANRSLSQNGRWIEI